MLRFLPDANTENTFFWTERQFINLPFADQVVSVPCIEMFGDTCPILAETRPWWKDPKKELLARLYWKKKSYVFQGFDLAVRTKIVRPIITGPATFEAIKNSLMNPEFEDLPTDYRGGRDFDPDKKQWTFKSRPLSRAERKAAKAAKPLCLYKGSRPFADFDTLLAMFHASLRNEPFDDEAFGRLVLQWPSDAIYIGFTPRSPNNALCADLS